jgi:hypothetical protein
MLTRQVLLVLELVHQPLGKRFLTSGSLVLLKNKLLKEVYFLG